ncbi:Permease of the drug/metabolite transporter (DMT) superfamily [Halapricum desulfuricans]|uniref:Permease of the drug/metabolite transporter (DMT) superfamily n=1 Tax=Halapricum desulfuricans TaxID=2841257 RepID=A0A897NAI2_9EURY|nr:DMT family transporter [Halapricum desulfuricans]QSG11420.1 Permease of the drug/metabolite transporter (DMT) superfamily [Halapricum desulfuricans]
MVGRRTLALFAAASLLFGGTFVAAKAGLAYFPPVLFVAFRFDIAALALAAFAVATIPRSELVPRTRGDLLGIVATGGLVIGLANALLFVGQQSATSAVGAIIFGLNPILTPVFAALLLSDERLSARGAGGMALGLLGVVLVVDPDPATLLAGGFGKLLILAGAASGALGTVLVRRADATLSSTARTAWGLPLAAALTHGLSLATGESASAVVWSGEALLALGYVGVFAGAIAYIVYFSLIDTAGAIKANLIFYVVPAVATVGGWTLLGETISALTVAGFLTIFAGFALMGSESIATWWGSVRPASAGGDSESVSYPSRAD